MKELVLPFLLPAFLTFGGSYLYDLPQLLAEYFKEDLKIEDNQLLYLYSAYSFPNIGCVLLGGWFLNRFGAKINLLVYLALISIGYIVFVASFAGGSLAGMIIGRVFHGLAGENLMVAQYYLSHRFFGSTYLSMATGLDISSAYLASALAYFLSGWTFNMTQNLLTTLLLAGWALLASLLATAGIVCLFGSEQKIEKAKEAIEEYVKKQKTEDLALVQQSEENENIKEKINTENDLEGSEASKRKKFKFSDLKNFPLAYYLLLAIHATTTMSYFQLVNVLTTVLSLKFGIPTNKTHKFTFWMPLICLVIVPLFSRGVNKWGKKPLVALVGSFIGLGALIFLLYSSDYPFIFIILFSVYISLINSTLWSSLTLASEPVHVDIGLAITNTIQNLTSFICPLILGHFFPVLDPSNVDGYISVILAFVGAAIVFTSLFLLVDLWGDKSYSKPEI